MKAHAYCVAALMTVMTGPALALEAHVAKDTTASAADAWAAIGGFCGISKWHPGIVNCEESEKDGATFRTLTTKDGAKLFEKQTAFDPATMSYTYTIETSPLPVANYKATLKVVPKENGATFDWTGTFDAKDKPDAEVVKLITGIYEAGVDGLVAKTTK